MRKLAHCMTLFFLLLNQQNAVRAARLRLSDAPCGMG